MVPRIVGNHWRLALEPNVDSLKQVMWVCLRTKSIRVSLSLLTSTKVVTAKWWGLDIVSPVSLTDAINNLLIKQLTKRDKAVLFWCQGMKSVFPVTQWTHPVRGWLLLWFPSSGALSVLVCCLPSNLSFIKLHHVVPLSRSVYVRRFFFWSGFLEGVLGRHSTHSSSFQQTQPVLRPQTTLIRLRPFALNSCSQTNHVGQQGCGGRVELNIMWSWW